jgi:hypothetical protein
MPPLRRLLAPPLVLLAGTAAAQGDDGIRYGRDIRPILSDRCFRCHGPDAGTREADLRLDVRDFAVRARASGAAIVPGDPDRSLLVARIGHSDARERMPPPRSGKPALTAGEQDLLRRWIAAGAAYEPHWAFVPPQPQPVPEVAGSAHPVDRFLLAALHARGIPPAPLADRATQGRRLFLVLTGLPPTRDELAAFAADPRADAYERLVDRLLAEEPYRTRHAEHLAGIWLDAARYADTSGIHMDAGRQAWAWRDWLIAALRDDKPYDEFVVEQLAGDLLPDATTEQQVATGFLRHHVTTDEGGAIDEEYRVEYAAERTATVGSVFLGLTLQCARCHDHKFDPIRQQDYYRLFAFFNSNDEPGLYSQLPDPNRALEPFLAVPTPAQQDQRQRLERELAAAEADARTWTSEELAAYAAFQRDQTDRAIAWRQPEVLTAQSTRGAALTVDADGTIVAGGRNPSRDEHVVVLRLPPGRFDALALTALPHPEHPDGKVGRAPNGNAVLQHVQLALRAAPDAPWTPVLLGHAFADVEQQDGDFAVTNVLADDGAGWAVAAHQAPPRPARAVLLALAPFGADAPAELRVALRYDSPYAQHTFGRLRLWVGAAAPGLRAVLPVAAGGFHVAGPFDDDGSDLYARRDGPEQARAIDPSQRWGKVGWRFDAALARDVANGNLPTGRNATYVAQRVHSPDARRIQVSLGSDDGFQLFCNGALVAERRVDRGVAADQDQAEFDLAAGPNLLVLKVVNTGGLGGFALRHLPRGDDLAGDVQLSLLPDAADDAALQERIRAAWRLRHSPQQRQRQARVAELQAQLAALEAAIPRAMVMREAAVPRQTFLLRRGEYDKPDPEQPIARDLPALFGPLPAELPRNRLGLARWLVSADNPLLLRVQANRLWEFVFGRGIVGTSEDFGLQGEWPSDPALLDWLALELRRNGHSTRRLLRLLVTSDAFRRDARALPTARARDPGNRLLAFFPRRRLTAEAIRDQALYVAGLLVERPFGPSVKPYQPDGLWQEVAMTQSNTRVYVRGQGDELWRRSLYTYWKRACPPPALLTLDAPTREFCTIRRSATNTPLQALVLWNDEQFVEAARALAERTLAGPGDDDERLQAMHAACTGEMLAAPALADARALLQAMRERYAASPADAEALLAVGASPRASTPAVDTAAFTVLASAFLNLDATLWID